MISLSKFSILIILSKQHADEYIRKELCGHVSVLVVLSMGYHGLSATLVSHRWKVTLV